MTAEWAINGRFLAQNQSGVQRYAEEITRGLDTLLNERSANERPNVALLCPPGSCRLEGMVWVKQRVVGKRQGHTWEQFDLPRFVRDGLLSLGNTGPLAVRKQILCIHDVNTRLFPESYSRQFRLLYRVLLPALGRRAEHVTTVSAFSAAQLAHFKIAASPKITCIPNGHEHANAWVPQSSDAIREALDARTIVMIGSPAPHKNVALLLRLAPRLKEYGLKVAIAGSLDARVFAGPSQAGTFDALTRSENIVWLGRISNEELASVLQGCLCLAFPSYTEGFGLPALEAMALGCPVVASNRASIPEVCGSAALYAEPDDDETWLAHFRHLSADADLRARMSATGIAQSQRFSWRTSAGLYLDLMTKMATRTAS